MCKIWSKTPEQRKWCRSGVFINFNQTSYIALVFPYDFEQVNASWVQLKDSISNSFWSRYYLPSIEKLTAQNFLKKKTIDLGSIFLMLAIFLVQLKKTKKHM